jgi:predicted secreted protein
VQRIQEVRIGGVGGNRPPQPVAMRAMAAGAAAFAAPSAEPGQTTVQVEVEADIAVAPRAP